MKKLIASVAFGFASNGFAQRATLIGGFEADIRDFPASISAQFPLQNGYGSCTATIVGPQVLLIASHCVRDNPSGSFTVGANKYKIACNMSDLYSQGTDHDIALCKIDHPVTGVVFENLNLDSSLVKVGDVLQLTGYGCINSNRNGSGSGGNDGIYRVGEAMVKSLPSSFSYDYETLGASALCQGDSGGPSFKYLDAAKKFRVVVSANSKGNIVDTSYLASTSSEASVAFIKSWAKAKAVYICGVHQEASNCRVTSESAPKDRDKTPAVCSADIVESNVVVYKSCLGSSKATVTDCDKALDILEDCRANKN